VRNLAEVTPERIARMPTGISELDRVLGGGLVSGSVVLIGGDPGIGKSTLLLQAWPRSRERAGALCQRRGILRPDRAARAAPRAPRRPPAPADREPGRNHLASAQNEQPQVIVVDSIQTMFTEILQSAPGSVAQVRESAAQLVRYAKQTGTACFSSAT
jgi:DNA repair protein RadA/Sms